MVTISKSGLDDLIYKSMVYLIKFQ